jgi:hypothetical protein
MIRVGRATKSNKGANKQVDKMIGKEVKRETNYNRVCKRRGT